MLHHFTYIILCVDKMSLQCTSEKWSLTRISPMPVVQSSIVYTCIETVHMGHTTPEFTDRFTEGRCNVNVCNVQIMVINVYYGLDRKHTKTVIIISMLHNILPHV